MPKPKDVKLCVKCGQGTVKPERVECKHCGCTEWACVLGTVACDRRDEHDKSKCHVPRASEAMDQEREQLQALAELNRHVAEHDMQILTNEIIQKEEKLLDHEILEEQRQLQEEEALEDGVCPTCGQSIEEDADTIARSEHNSIVEEHNSIVDKLHAEIAELKEEVKLLSE